MKSLLTCIFLLLSSSAYAAPTLKEIEKQKLPGRKQYMECMPYAFCMNYYLFSQGVESKMVMLDLGNAKIHHAIVFFKLNDPKTGKAIWYGIDNETARAKELSGTTDFEMGKSFNPRCIRVYPPNSTDLDNYNEETISKWVKKGKIGS